MKFFKNLFKHLPETDKQVPVKIATTAETEASKLTIRLNLAGALLRTIGAVPNVTYVDGASYMMFLAAFEHEEELRRVGQWLEDQKICNYAVKRIRAYQSGGLHMPIPHKIFDELPLVLNLAMPRGRPSDRYVQAEKLNSIYTLRGKAKWLCSRVGAPSFIVTRVTLDAVTFSVPTNVAWTLWSMEDFLAGMQCRYALEVIGERATLTIDNPALMRIPHSDRPKPWELNNADEERDEDVAADDEDEDDDDPIRVPSEITAIDTAKLQHMARIVQAAQKLTRNAEYRVNHVFKGESSSFYVRKQDLDELKAAFKDYR